MPASSHRRSMRFPNQSGYAAMKKAILAVLAHPDDGTFGPGGTLAKVAVESAEVHICMATDTFIRAYQPAPDGFREFDLFHGYHR